jgi:hypothetical protein
MGTPGYVRWLKIFEIARVPVCQTQGVAVNQGKPRENAQCLPPHPCRLGYGPTIRPNQRIALIRSTQAALGSEDYHGYRGFLEC